VPAGEPAKLGAAIVAAWAEYSQSSAQWRKRRRRAREHIARNFTFEKMADAYARVWREVAFSSETQGSTHA